MEPYRLLLPAIAAAVLALHPHPACAAGAEVLEFTAEALTGPTARQLVAGVATSALGGAAAAFLVHELNLDKQDADKIDVIREEIRRQNQSILQVLNHDSETISVLQRGIALQPPRPVPAPVAAAPPPLSPALLHPPTANVRACNAGDPPAEAMRRATILDRGDGIPHRDAPAAALCYAVAAQAGLPEAQYNLADMLLTGDDGVARDPASAAEWLQNSAAQRFVPAYLSLATMYERGDAGPKNPQRAFYWYFQAADAGDAFAQFQLSRYFWFGLASPKDRIAAFSWLDLALDAGYAPARATMKQLLDIVVQDARAGVAGAQYLMGLAFTFGVPDLIAADNNGAYRWLSAAAAQRWAPAQAALNNLCRGDPQACTDPHPPPGPVQRSVD